MWKRRLRSSGRASEFLLAIRRLPSLPCRVIDRYSLPEMRGLWTEQRKLEIWLEIETLACEAMAELGTIPREDAVTIREKAPFDIEKVREIEKRTNHDVI